jgi:uncharacterized protein YecE (DUF72 family)
MAARIHIGTSSWTDKELVGSGRFYPAEVKDSESRLSYYADRFNLVEVDSTYYAMPSTRNSELWASRTPEGFRFDVKAFALFTGHPTPLASIPKSFHERLPSESREKARLYAKDVPEDVRAELWAIFRNTLRPLQRDGRLGAILFDLPPWAAPSEANRGLVLEAAEHLTEYRIVVQFRSPAWVNAEHRESTLAFLRERDLGLVCVDEPQGLKTSIPPLAEVTGPMALVRFFGRKADTWERRGAATAERFDWLYSDEELGEWLTRIEKLAAQAQEVHLMFNTKVGDQGVQNAVRLQGLLGLHSRQTAPQ